MFANTSDFPILSRQVHGKRLVYLDNAATTQKPLAVIQAITDYYTNHNANIHRGVHTLSDESTKLFETSKATIAAFFGAQPQELIFTQNTTQAINAVAYGWGMHNLQPGDVIFTSLLDHHANIVTLQQLAHKTSSDLIFIEITQDGELDIHDFTQKLVQYGKKLKLVALPHVSNTLGSIVATPEVVRLVRSHSKARLLLDAAQSAGHMPLDFHKLDADFCAFSGHKMLAPMGVGGLLVKAELLESGQMQPWLFGGGMISAVFTDKTQFHQDLNERFLAGTPDVASVAGLAAACEYFTSLGGMHKVRQHDQKLVEYAVTELAKVPKIMLLGTQDAQKRVGSVTFLYEGVHAHDVAQVLDSQGVAVRSGHHCTMPLHTANNWIATTRASFQVYNTTEDIDALVAGLQKVQTVLG